MECIVWQSAPKQLTNAWRRCRWRLKSFIALLTILNFVGVAMVLGLGLRHRALIGRLRDLEIAESLLRAKTASGETKEQMAKMAAQLSVPDDTWHFELLKGWDHSLRSLRIRPGQMTFKGPLCMEGADHFSLDINLAFSGSAKQLIRLFDLQHQLKPSARWTRIEWQTDSKKRINLAGKIRVAARELYLNNNRLDADVSTDMMGEDANSLEVGSLPLLLAPLDNVKSEQRFKYSLNSQTSPEDLLPDELVMVGWLGDRSGIAALMQTARGDVFKVRKGDTLGKEEVLEITEHALTTTGRCYEL